MLEEAEWTPPDEFDEYRIIRELGRGSMGSVYLARDIVLDRPVAMKFLGALRPDPAERERFLVEARAIARIQHPNVMSIFRVGEVKGRLYLVTEYIRGQNLADLQLPLPWNEVLGIGIGLARGLSAAHRQGVLHRDIKLSNAVIEEGAQVKLLDFGLAKLVDGSVDRKPVQASGSPVDENTAEMVVRAVKNARQMVVQRLADTIKIDSHPATAPTPRVQHSSDNARTQGHAGANEEIESEPVNKRLGRESLGVWHGRLASITRAGTVMGTPHYMAPELWLADPASRRSDVYALGVVLFILAVGRPPHDAESPFDLAMQVQEKRGQSLVDLAPTVDAKFAAVVERCLARDPYDRYASGDEVRAALERLVIRERSTASVPKGNPYRGLQAFEAEHRSLFFGRSVEVRSVIERLRHDSFVVVAGDSGVGKSSLCRAGVIPSIVDGELAIAKAWRAVTMIPGRYPRQSFVAVLAQGFGLTEDVVSDLLKQEPGVLVRTLRKQLGRTGGCLIFLDQFEEFVTIAEPAEVESIGPALVRLMAGIPGLRVLATVRGDFLTRVATVPGLGDELARGIFLLRPLSPEGAREAIVGPAEANGVSFESEKMVDELVAAGVQGSLPLLQFALAELWESRDKSTSVITEAELRTIGGVTGALARHADGVLANLLPDQRAAARRLLMRLVTLENTRASLTEEELVASDEASKTALDALVRGRLLVVREAGERIVHEIAHEALVSGWSQLAGWLEDAEDARAVMYRLEQAAAEWERLGKGREGLWSLAQVAEVRAIHDLGLRPREEAFVDASASGAARAKALRRLAIVTVPIIAVVIYSAIWIQNKVEMDHRVEGHVVEAGRLLEIATSERQMIQERKAEAFKAFHEPARERAEVLWAEVLSLMSSERHSLAMVVQELETAYSLDRTRDDVRASLADALLRQAKNAIAAGERENEDVLRARLSLYDPDGERRAQLDAPVSLTLTTDPPDAEVSIARIRTNEQGVRVAGERAVLGSAPTPNLEAEGNYTLTLVAEGYEKVVYPLTVRAGERLALHISLPRAGTIADGFAYIPAGRFLFGAAGDDDARRMIYSTVPIHVVNTGSYLIAKHETTFGEYIDFLSSLEGDERSARQPESGVARLVAGPEASWTLEWSVGPNIQRAKIGETLQFPRSGSSDPNWANMPVVGVSIADVSAYASWLDSSGRLPGARLCTDIEWERAARGSDGRIYPHGDVLRPEQANFDLTFGKDTLSMVPEEVGSRPLSRSPFGLDDMSGNAYEWVRSSVSVGFAIRGGACSLNAFVARSLVREEIDPATRAHVIGFRICATYTD